MYTVSQTTPVGNIYGYSIILGTGIGLWMQSSFSVAQAVVPPSFIASAVGFITSAQFLGITLALAIANSIFLNSSQRDILKILPNVAVEEVQAAMQGARNGFFETLSEDVREQVLGAIVNAIAETYIVVLTVGALVVLLSLLMKRERLFKLVIMGDA